MTVDLNFPRSWGLAATLGILAVQLTGCANAPATPAGPPVLSALRDAPAALARDGVERLIAGDTDAAARHFQAAIKLRPNTAAMHLLLGLAYHAAYQAGGNTLEAAATAYEVAARLDPRDALPFTLRGHLAYAARDYATATSSYAKALARTDTPDREAVTGLMASAYYAGDLTLAELALQQARTLGDLDEAALRLSALLATVRRGVGDAPVAAPPELAHRFGYSPHAMAGFNRRLGDLSMMMVAVAADAGAGSAGGNGDAKEPPDKPDASADSAGVPKLRKWFDCDLEPGYFKTAERGGDSGEAKPKGGDETTPLPPIPGVCSGSEGPRVVHFDTTILRLQEVTGSGYGVDFLGSLNVFLSGGNARTVNISDGASSSTGTRTLSYALGSTPSANYISYALSIANVFGSRSEIVSQPSIVAIDRLPATFFSGAVLTLGMSGSEGSSSSITDKPVGVSLSVTPTVMDDDRLHINVRVARSALASTLLGPASSTFSQTLATTRTSVSTSLTARFDETILISGLAENEVTSGDTGTPLLKDIPLLQTLFSRQTEMRTSTSIVVALTPRRYGVDRVAGEAPGTATDPLTRARLSQLARQMGEGSGMASAMRRLRKDAFFTITRDSDVRYQPLKDRDWLARIARNVGRMVYRQDQTSQ